MFPIYTIGGEPKYFYSYGPTKIKCDTCDKIFLHTELCKGEYDVDDEYEYSDTICPFCDAFKCCELTFEALDESQYDFKSLDESNKDA